MKYDVFISHSSKDLELSEKICDYLQEQGIKCWIDSRNVTGLYARSIIEGIEQSELMVLVYSGKANSSAHVENEIDNAFCLGKMIIPFRIEGTPYSNVLRYYLNKSHYVDGMPDPLNALEQLRDQIKRNMSEQKQLEAIDEAFKTIAQWADINVDELRAYIKNIKEPEQNSEENEQGDRYDILQNEEGKIVIVINDHEGEPDNPRIVYDGTDKAYIAGMHYAIDPTPCRIPYRNPMPHFPWNATTGRCHFQTTQGNSLKAVAHANVRSGSGTVISASRISPATELHIALYSDDTDLSHVASPPTTGGS